MNEWFSGKTKFQVKVDKHCNGWWSFGICFSHQWEETYLYITFFKWGISIGKLCVDEDLQEEEMKCPYPNS